VSKITLFVSIEVSPESYIDFLAALKSHIKIVKSEPGCEFIEIFREGSNQSTMHLWEVWSDRSSWDAHMENTNSLEWRARMSPIVRSETIKILNQL